MVPTTQELAAYIRTVRTRGRFTQAQFAKKLGVSQQKLSDWENGKRLRQLVDAMKVLDALQKL